MGEIIEESFAHMAQVVAEKRECAAVAYRLTLVAGLRISISDNCVTTYKEERKTIRGRVSRWIDLICVPHGSKRIFFVFVTQ